LLNSSPLGTGPSSHERKIPHEHLCCLRLTSTTLTTHQDRLAAMIIDQRPVTSVRNGEEMGAELPKGGVLVLLHHVRIIEVRQPLERVHRNQDVPGVRLSSD
jgi:hypothetical protein